MVERKVFKTGHSLVVAIPEYMLEGIGAGLGTRVTVERASPTLIKIRPIKRRGDSGPETWRR